MVACKPDDRTQPDDDRPPRGPRCCKRDSWLAIRTAVTFLSERFGVTLPVLDTVRCEFGDINRECLREACPFHAGYPTG
nr:DUF5714 domain-containing protein [Methanoculleus sp. 10]